MSQFTATADHPVRVEATPDNPITLLNRGDTFYYGQTSSVSASSNDGSVTAGASLPLTVTTWVRSASQSVIERLPLPPSYDPSRLPSSVAYATTAYVDSVVATSVQTALSASAAAGALTLTVQAPAPPAYGMVVVEPYSSNAEIRHISSSSGSNVTITPALTFAHSSGARAFFVQGSSVPAAWWAAKGDNSTDDILALQAAVRSLSKVVSNWPIALNGQDKVFRISQPLLLPNFSSLERIAILAKSNYAPDDTNGAMVMTQRGTVQTFTASAADDTFTTPAAHGMTLSGTGSRVVFKGTSLPGGVTAGKVYFIKTVPTATTFTISATSGGATLDVTSDGSGEAYPDPQAECRVFFRQLTIDGQNLGSNISGLAMDVQQPSESYGLRINNCTQDGMRIYSGAQQMTFYNTELIHNGNGLTLSDAKFLYFFGIDIEQSINRHFYIKAASACLFHGVHIESAGSTPTVVDLEGTHDTLVWQNIQYSVDPISGKGWWQHTGNLENTGYTIRNLRAVGNGATGHKVISDDDRGLNLDIWDDYRFRIESEIFPAIPTSSSFTNPNLWALRSTNGGFFKLGGRYGAPRVTTQNDADNNVQPQYRANDRSGNEASGFNWDGVLYTKRVSAPADADLVAGQLAFWLDQTNGACKAMFKAKQADGTVKSGSVTLS